MLRINHALPWAVVCILFCAGAAHACGNGLPPSPSNNFLNPGTANFRNTSLAPAQPYSTGTSTKGLISSAGSEYGYSLYSDTTCTCGGLAKTDVKWAYSDEEVRKQAPLRNQAFAIFFCNEVVARLAGEGSKAFDEFKKTNSGVAPPVTLFEYSLTQNQFTMAGIEMLLKVPDVREYAELYKKYDVTAGTLIVCAPDGTRLATFVGSDCNAIKVVGFLNNDFDKKMETWMQANKKPDDVAAFKKTQEARRKAAGGVSPIIDERIQNGFRFGPKIITGGFPTNDATFQALKELGVKTIIRVDAEAPPTERADKLGMTYLHFPVSYSGLPHDRALQLAKLVRDMPGPIYLHCNCGKHRSPAAAGVVSVILGDMTPQQAVAAMWVCGTFTDYTGLYASAENETKQSNETLDAVQVALTAKAETSPMAAAMADLDKSWRRIEALKAAKWKVADPAKSADIESELTHIGERLLESGSWEQLKKAPNAAALTQDAQSSIAQMLKEWRSSAAQPAGTDALPRLDSALLNVQQSCFNCHNEYRNAVAPAKK